jgi:putative ABC transport system substrate-binding protein
MLVRPPLGNPVNRLRRVLLVALAALPAVARAAPPARVAWLAPGSAAKQGHYVVAFREGMRENGLQEGRDYVLDVQYADGHYERFPAMVEAALQRDPAVMIMVAIPSVRAAQRATRTVPIVFVSTTDPVGSGLVASLAQPGGNTTGISNQAEDAVTKYVDLLREALPQARRIAVLLNPANPGNVAQYQRLRGFAPEFGMTLEAFEARTPEELDAAFQAIARYRPDVLLMIADSMLFQIHERIVAFALKERLPTIAPTPEHGESGMLFAYGASRPEMYRRAATYVRKILAGARPADLPVEQPTRFELAVNLKTARALGIKVPQAILLRADRVIE